MNLDKLKESARKYEQGGQWRQAVDVYKKALREFEESGESVPDPSLYNRVGDLELKSGDTSAAVRAYEAAADLYTEQGFFNNAIALCGKILRINASRTATYLRLAQLNARKNFVGEARRNLLEYVDRMEALNHREEAFNAVHTFADQFCGNPEVRVMLIELLVSAAERREGRAQFRQLAEELERREGGAGAAAGGLTQIPDVDALPKASRGRELIFIDVGVPVAGSAESESEDEGPVEALDIDRPEDEVDEWRRDTSSAVQDFEIATDDADQLDAAPSLPPDLADPGRLSDEAAEETGEPAVDIDAYPPVDAGEELDPEVTGYREAEVPAYDPLTPDAFDAREEETVAEPPAEEAPGAEFVPEPAPGEADEDLVFLPVSQREDEADPLAESAIGASGDQAQTALDRGRLLAELGDRTGAVEAMEDALHAFEATGRYEDALSVADELSRLEPGAVFRYQKRVELAYRCGRRDVMLQAYLGLADVLLRNGGTEHAVVVYRRVLEHDPDNPIALDALASLTGAAVEPDLEPVVEAYVEPDVEPEAPAPPPARQPEPRSPPPPELKAPRSPDPGPGSFVDLGSLILDEPSSRDTRIRVDQAAPIEDEDQAFHEALAQFKRGIEENLDVEDFQAHYDLGIAFKEMGLLDEAIAQFQKALRSPEGRLKTSEQLGISFYEKGRYAIAEAVLRRAIDSLPGGDEEKIGLVYWLGRAVEAQRRTEEAIRFYERALAVDIQFLDVSDRMYRLSVDPS